MAKSVPNLPASSRLKGGSGLGSQIKGALKSKPLAVVAGGVKGTLKGKPLAVAGGAVKGANISGSKGTANKVLAMAKKGSSKK